jgi:hypothetical protein
MVVDFELRKSRGYSVASMVRIGEWKEDNLRTEFRELARWAQKNALQTGHWIFVDAGGNPRRWEACLEIKGRAKPEGRIRLKALSPTWVARVIFDPDLVSSRIVYHGLNDWTRWRRRYKEIRKVTSVREVYTGDPWRNPKAWAHCEVQFLITK